jgi:hypothetical protein
MAWRPIPTQSNQAERLSPFVRAVISRCTLGLVSLALLYGSYRCIRLSLNLMEEARQTRAQQSQSPLGARRTRALSGAGLPMTIGIGLGALGLIAALGAVMPTSFFTHFARPPADTRQRIAAPRDYFKS